MNHESEVSTPLEWEGEECRGGGAKHDRAALKLQSRTGGRGGAGGKHDNVGLNIETVTRGRDRTVT